MKTTLLVTVLVSMLFASSTMATRQPNIIVITIDALRPDHLGCYGYEKPVSPTLDSLAASGTIFTNAFSSAAWTSPGLLSLLTGRHEPAHGITTREKNLTPGVPTMAGELVNAGYTAPDICYLIGAPNYQNLGFQDFPQKQDFLTAGHDILFRWLDEFGGKEQPFLLYYHYRDLHQPYDPSPPFDTLFMPDGAPPSEPDAYQRYEKVRSSLLLPPGSIQYAESDTGWICGLYDGELAQFDITFLRPLLGKLRALGVDANTLIIISADHGEELLDHGAVGHASTAMTSSLFDETLRIPLVASWPGVILPGGKVEEQVQIVDIMPTLFDLLDISIPEDVQGRSLAAALKGDAIDQRTVFISSVLGGYQATREMQGIHLRAIRTPTWKLIKRDTEKSGAQRWLYHIKTDPMEMTDVSEANNAVADSMEALLSQWLVDCLSLYTQPLWTRTDTLPWHPEKPVVLSPTSGESLSFAGTGGRLGVRLNTPGRGQYEIEYNVGTGPYHVEGTIVSTPEGVSFGPFSPAFWGTLVRYNPWQFRVLPAGRPKLATGWITFNLEPESSS